MAGRRGRRRCSGRRRMPRKGRCGRPSRNWWQRWDARRRRTQGRRLEMAGRLTGVSGGLKEREREQIADAVGSGDHDRAVGRAPLGAQLAEPRSSDRGGAGGAGVQRDAGGSHGCGWCGERSVGAAAPAAGGALGAGWQELAGGRERRFRSAGTAALPAALGNGHRRPRKRPFEPSRTALR